MTPTMIEATKDEVEAAPEVTVTRNRFGYEIDGRFLRRVTTFCQGLPKPWLGSWAAKEVAEFAIEHRESWSNLPKTDALKLLKGAPWSKRDNAGDRGTAVHCTLEALVKGQPIPDNLTTEDELDCAIAAEAFLKARGSRVLGTEITVFSPKYGFAGTLDLWEMDRGGVTWILDWKTSGDVYTEHAIQLAAYRNAEYAIVQKRQDGDEKWVGRRIPWGPMRAERLGVVHVRPDGATLYPICYSERLWTVFRAAAHVKLWQLDTDDFAGKKPRERVFEDAIESVLTKEAV